MKTTGRTPRRPGIARKTGIPRTLKMPQQQLPDEALHWHYSHIVEQMSEAVFIIDADFKFSFVNKSFEALFGYPADGLIGQPLRMLEADDSTLLQARQVLITLGEHGNWRGEVLHRKADGSALNAVLGIRSAYDAQGHLLGYVGTYYDLNEPGINSARLRQTMVGTIHAIALTLEKRDPYTSSHQKRVAKLCVALAQSMGKDAEFIEGLRLGALIHDIGNIQIPSEILHRPGRLSPDEMALVHDHPQHGHDIMECLEFPWPVKSMSCSTTSASTAVAIL